MSEEQLKAFLEKVKPDTELQEKCKAVASYEEAMDIAKAAGFSITEDDIQSMQSASDDELEAASGGIDWSPHCYVLSLGWRGSQSGIICLPRNP